MNIDLVDSRRMQHTALRNRILDGAWENDLRQYIGEYIDAARSSSWGSPAQEINTLVSVVTQISRIYDKRPNVSNVDESANLSPLSPLFNLHQQHERYVLTDRESAIRIDWREASHLGPGGLSVRLVTPEHLVIDDIPTAPGVPAIIKERRKRTHPETKRVGVYWDVWDISDPSAPSYRIVSDESGLDCSPDFLGEAAREPYRYVTESGAPFLPWVLYHAKPTGRVWDPYTWSELVHATLAMGLYGTFFKHAIKDGSWVQKYGINLALKGAGTAGVGDNRRTSVSTDPASILMFTQDGNEAASLGSFPLPVDPDKLITSIQHYQRMVNDSLGIDQWQSEGPGNVSGVAIRLQRDTVRRLSEANMPQFKLGDIELLEKGARIYNLFSDRPNGPLPVSGYAISYNGVPPSVEEQTTELDRDLKMIQIGLKSPVDIVLKANPDMDRATALQYLLTIKAEKAVIDAVNIPPQ